MDPATVQDRIQASIQAKQGLLAQADAIAAAARAIATALQEGHRVYLFGNGGSAADAQHIAAELSGQFYLKDRAPLPAMALTTNTSALTAIANDYGYDVVFERQLEALGQDGDVAIGISTSGNSQNVIDAMEVARKQGLVTMALTGAGGKLPGLVDHALQVPSEDTPRIQEGHILIGHILCELVEAELFGDAP